MAGLKLFDGRPTIREDFYKKGLLAIVEHTDERTDAYKIAQVVLDYANQSGINPHEAAQAVENTINSTVVPPETDSDDKGGELSTA